MNINLDRFPGNVNHSAQSIEWRNQLGFRDGDRGTHSSRTMMLAELRRLLNAVPIHSKYSLEKTAPSKADYRNEIVHENVLGKPTQSARSSSAQKLVELYGLDPNLTVFRLLRFFWALDELAQPTLALLCALARDPLFRTTIDLIIQTPLGAVLDKREIEQEIEQNFPLSPKDFY